MPLSVWATRGFDANVIKEKIAPDDCREHPVLGTKAMQAKTKTKKRRAQRQKKMRRSLKRTTRTTATQTTLSTTPTRLQTAAPTNLQSTINI